MTEAERPEPSGEEQVAEPSEPASQAAPPPAGRRRWIIVAVVAAVVLIAAATVGFVVTRDDPAADFEAAAETF